MGEKSLEFIWEQRVSNSYGSKESRIHMGAKSLEYVAHPDTVRRVDTGLSLVGGAKFTYTFKERHPNT